MSDAITAAARKFIAMRREKLKLREKRDKIRCADAGDDYNAACFYTDEPQSDWCAECKQRQIVHDAYHVANNKAAGALRALENAVNKEPK